MDLAVARHSQPRSFVRLGLALAAGALLGATGASLAGGLSHHPAAPASHVQPAQAPGQFVDPYTPPDPMFAPW